MPVKYEFDKKRFEAFIDAIIAILLTILVLEIKIPESKTEHDSTFDQVRSLIPYLISYFASFILIFGYWIDYHLLFVNIVKINLRFILINMFFILSVSLTPFATAFAGKNYQDSFAVALLATTYSAINLCFMCVYMVAKSENLADPDFWKTNKAIAIYSAIAMLAIIVSIPLAYVNTYISFAIFIVVFGGHLIKNLR